MVDIVERLRIRIHTSEDETALTNQAADEIERLREALKECCSPFEGTVTVMDWQTVARLLSDELQRRIDVASDALQQKESE